MISKRLLKVENGFNGGSVGRAVRLHIQYGTLIVSIWF